MSRLIDADALSRIVKLAWETSDSEDFEKSVFIAIATAPTIEERKKGKWIDGKVKHIKNGELRNVRECSECGSSYFVYDNYNSVDEIPNYCPNCGSYNGGET